MSLENGLLLAAGALGGVLLLRALLRCRLGRRGTGAQEQADRWRERADLEGLRAQLAELSRHIDAQIEDQLPRLEAAIRGADERIARLATLQARAEAADLPAAAPQVCPSASERRPVTGQRIYELTDAGQSPLGIAETLGIPLGEVEVILGLRHFAGR